MRILVKNIKELVQVERNPRLRVCGKEMAHLDTIKNAYLIVENDKIAEFGEMSQLKEQTFDQEVDASDRMVFPTFCDSHTHLVYAGSREIEYIDARMLNNNAVMSTKEPIEVELTLKRNIPEIKDCVIGIGINNSADARISTYYTNKIDIPAGSETFKVHVTLPNHQLAKGVYSMRFNVLSGFDYIAKPREYDVIEKVLSFEVKYFDLEHTHDFVFWPHHMGSVAGLDAKPVIKTGAEFPFTRYFYKYLAPENSDDILARIRQNESDIMDSLQSLSNKKGKGVVCLLGRYKV